LIIIFITSFSYSKEIKLGMTADFSGPVEYLGINTKIGVETYLNLINKNSEIKYKLISYDDKYNPIIASNNIRKLINEDVVAFIGNVGTPTANVTLPIINENKIISIGAYTGGNVLRTKATNEYIFNYRVSYFQEAYYIVSNLLLNGIKPEEIAFFTQNDTYGDSGYSGAIKALRDFGFYDVNKLEHGRYTRGTLNVENALSKIYDSKNDIKAIVMVSVDAPTVKFISYTKEDFPNMKFFLLSPVNLSIIKKEFKNYYNDIYTTQVVPLITSNLDIVKEYKESLKEYLPNEKPNLTSLEGFISTKLFFEAIKDIDQKNITRESIVESLNKFNEIDINLGYKKSFEKNSHQYSEKIWFIKLDENGNEIEANWNNIFR
jgi:branched-chain amino acid transport system substrate-binding protein